MASYFGTAGNDYYNYTGSESLYARGYAGNDTIWGNDGNDAIYGEEGNDTLYGWSGNDTLYGGSGNDALYGGAANDSLYGDTGNDLLNGGSGNDFLSGFSGGYNQEIDTLTGGTGSDTFVLGDATGICYLGGLRSDGKDYSYAQITDWDASDYIQAWRDSSKYQLKTGSWLGSSARDTGIYCGNDLIGVIQDSTNVSFSRNFRFVGNTGFGDDVRLIPA